MAKKAQAHMVTSATVKHVRIPPRKARLILNMLKGKQLEPALNILNFSPNKGAAILEKAIKSAVANAQEKGSVDVDDLWIIGGRVDMGKTMKRFIPRAQGRATPIRKRSSHITVELGTYGSAS